MQNVVKRAPLIYQPCILLGVMLFSGLRRVSLAEYILVLRVYPTMLQVLLSAC
jgi:hypothetical protein